VKPGRPWGEPLREAPEVEVSGDDTDLAALVGAHRGALVRFHPTPRSDLARAVGITGGGPGTLAAPLDALDLGPDGHAVNAVVLGTHPARLGLTTPSAALRVSVNGRPTFDDRATTVVVANGQFLDGLDVVPRGHPGDGRMEIQVYALRRGERKAMRSRLPQGTHLPHPRITTASGRSAVVTVAGGRLLPLTIDGVAHDPVDELRIDLLPRAIRLVL
jgi:YegS C-terminal NAD kinase beta sandwich-like domain